MVASLQPRSPPLSTAGAATPPTKIPLSSDCGRRSSFSSQSNPPTKTPFLRLCISSRGRAAVSLSRLLLLDCIMPLGSKKSSASSNSTGTMHNTAAVRVETATTPASEILTSTPLTVASPSTCASASGKCTCISLSPVIQH